MPTAGERLATIEERVDNIRDDLRTLIDVVGDKSKPDSVRGRLHKLEGLAASMVLRRNYGVGLLKGWERVVLVGCAVVTAAAAWYGVVH